MGSRTANSVKLTETFTVAVGEKLDRDALQAARVESGKKIRIAGGFDDCRYDISRLNIHLDEKDVVTKLTYG